MNTLNFRKVVEEHTGLALDDENDRETLILALEQEWEKFTENAPNMHQICTKR